VVTPSGSAYNAGCELADPSLYDQPTESVPWRFTSMTGSTTTSGLPLPLAAESPITYDRGTPRNWSSRFGLHEYDIPRWRATPLVTDAPESIPDAALNGILWSHTRARAGGAVLDPATRCLASHYLSGVFAPSVTSLPMFRRFMEPLGPFARGWDWFGGRAFVVRDSRLNAAVIVSRGAAVSALTREQEVEFANFAYPGPWVAAAETTSELRNTTVRYVALDPNGVAVRLGELNGEFVNLDVPQCVPGQCPPNGPFVASAPSAPAPFDPTGEIVVLSAARETLWALRDATATERARMAAYDLASDVWRDVEVPLASDILAATYSSTDDVLWVLDQISVQGRRYARLLAVHPETGWGTEAARWRRVTSHDRFALAATSGGGLYLASGAYGAFAVAYLAPSHDAVELRGVRVGVGTLSGAHALSVDDDGVSVLVARPLEYATVDYQVGSFHTGGWGSCL